MSDQWMSIVEYARTFSISDMTIRRRIKSGKIHAVLREGKYYIPVKMTDAGKFIPQRKTGIVAEPENEEQTPRTPAVEPQIPRLIPRQISISPNQSATSQNSLWEHRGVEQRSRPNIELSEQHKSPYYNGVLLTANGEAHEFQNTSAGATSLPSRPNPYNYNNSATQITAQADAQIFSQLSHKIENMISLTRDTLGRLDREKRHIQGEFEQKILAQQEQLKNRDMEVQNLRQKLEDMQLLIKIMESKQVKAQI